MTNIEGEKKLWWFIVKVNESTVIDKDISLINNWISYLKPKINFENPFLSKTKAYYFCDSSL